MPNCIEAALPGFCVSSWHAIVVPAGTPRGVVNKLQQTLKATLANAELREQLLAREDATAVASTPESLQNVCVRNPPGGRQSSRPSASRASNCEDESIT